MSESKSCSKRFLVLLVCTAAACSQPGAHDTKAGSAKPRVSARRHALTGTGSAIIDEDKPIGQGCYTSSAYYHDYTESVPTAVIADGRNDDGSSPLQSLPFQI